MSGGGKKFNIWIAYSDLFTNLSTFLFISALGVFAAIGSGVLVVDRETNPSMACTIPSEIAASLQQPPGLVSELPTSRVSQSDCFRFYRIDHFRFRSSDARLSSFRDDDGVPLGNAGVLSQICMPLWRFISQKGFRDREGRLVLRGIAATASDWPPDARCPRREQDAPRINVLPIDYDGPHINIIRACERDPWKSFPRYCRHIAPCLDRRGGSRLCREVRAVIDWEDRSRMACQQQAARQQAYVLYGLCERAPSDVDFQDEQLDSPQMVDEARREDRRGGLWERVDYGAHIRREGNAPSHLSVLDAQSAGSIVVEVRYGR